MLDFFYYKSADIAIFPLEMNLPHFAFPWLKRLD